MATWLDIFSRTIIRDSHLFALRWSRSHANQIMRKFHFRNQFLLRHAADMFENMFCIANAQTHLFQKNVFSKSRARALHSNPVVVFRIY